MHRGNNSLCTDIEKVFPLNCNSKSYGRRLSLSNFYETLKITNKFPPLEGFFTPTPPIFVLVNYFLRVPCTSPFKMKKILSSLLFLFLLSFKLNSLPSLPLPWVPDTGTRGFVYIFRPINTTPRHRPPPSSPNFPPVNLSTTPSPLLWDHSSPTDYRLGESWGKVFGGV